MTPELLALAKRAGEQTTATEAAEIGQDLAALCEGRNPICYLLTELFYENRDSEAKAPTLKRAYDLCLFANDDQLVRHMLSLSESGQGDTLVAIKDFLESLALWHQDSLRLSLARYRTDLHTWCESRRAALAHLDGNTETPL